MVKQKPQSTSIAKRFLTIFPVLIVVAMLPFMLTFDTVVYWLTRPSCLNCGSLTDFLKNSSLTYFAVSTYVGQLRLGNYSFGRKNYG